MAQPEIDGNLAIIRDFIAELDQLSVDRWNIINKHNLIDALGNIYYPKYLELFHATLPLQHITTVMTRKAYLNDMNNISAAFKERNINRAEPFEFFTHLDLSIAKPQRLEVSPGIRLVPFKYHEILPIEATSELPETGFTAPVQIRKLMLRKYPAYYAYLSEYHRPLGTTDATFTDFNKPQYQSEPFSDERRDQVLDLVKFFMNVKPYVPIKFKDTPHAGMPLSTGTGYYDRTSYFVQSLARLSRPDRYKHMPQSKGYTFNATIMQQTHIAHNIKSFCSPIDPNVVGQENSERAICNLIANRVTMLFTRVHISKHDKSKVRPVYNVDPLFLRIEAMLTLPLMVQTRPANSCLMYSYETIRGGCHALDTIAQTFKSFFTIDWSSFDQTLPRVITDLFFTHFLESLIIINKRYASSIIYDRPNPDDIQKYYNKISNILHFLHEWYNDMIFVTADGYAYQREQAGVPSGLFNTQILDSFGNLVLILDAFIEYGFTIDEIRSFRLFIMGDDNTGFTNVEITKLIQFINWFEAYALTRWNMTLSTAKSIVTQLRNRIEILGYTCNFGTPTRSIGKLVAQLAYPEHGLKVKYMSYRALGIAYAAAGCDSTFHDFCRDVYLEFLPYQTELDTATKFKLTKHLPGVFQALDDYFELVDHTHFPSIHEVRAMYQKWQGSLSFAPKWDTSFFINQPFYQGDDYITIQQYRHIHKLQRPEMRNHKIDETLVNTQDKPDVWPQDPN